MEGYRLTNQPSLRRELKQLVHFRALFIALTRRGIKLDYQIIWLGLSWTILQPFLSAGLFFVMLNNRLSGDHMRYFIYVYSGVVIWSFLGGSVSGSVSSLVENSSLLKKVYFPRFIIPLSYVASKFFNFLISYAVLFVLVIFVYNGIDFFSFLLFSIIGIICLVLVNSGLSLFFSSLAVRVKSMNAIVPFFIHILLFSSSGIYNPSLLLTNDLLIFLFQLNPLSWVLYIFRLGLIPDDPDWGLLLLYLAGCLSVFMLGFTVFWKRNKFIIDYL